jgi:probable rRNA maturation factor
LLTAHSAHLVIHAMLHLQGYDHTRAAEAVRMEAREVAILARLGFSDPYAPASSRKRRAPRTAR